MRKKMKYKEPDRLEVLDRNSHRRVVILSGHKCNPDHDGDNYLFISSDDEGARVPKYPTRGVIIPFDKFFAAINALVDSEITIWDREFSLVPQKKKRNKKREKKNCEK